MTYATLCSGIEGFGLGFDRAGMQCVYQCEIDAHCRKVLERHYPGIERGTDINDDEVAEALVRHRPNVLAFGSPCQDLSIAGKGRGLAGQRSGLFFRCVELAFICEAGGVVWENVPGALSSNGGADFASVLEAFTGFRPAVPDRGWRNTGFCIGPLYSVAWAVLDSQWFGVPQRRRRVFVVGSLGDRSGPYRILSLAESLPWDSPPRREAGARVAASLTAGTASGSGVNAPGRRREDDVNLVCGALTPGAHPGSYNGQDAYTGHLVAHTLRAEGHDASEDGTGRGVPLVPVAYQQHGSDVGPMGTLRRGRGDVQSGVPFIAEPFQTRCSRNGRGMPSDVVPALTSCEGGTHADTKPHVVAGSAVRRLTPKECERLQAFPDGWTEFGADGKRISNSQRYKMLGNAITVNVAHWIGRRIVAVDGGRTDEG